MPRANGRTRNEVLASIKCNGGMTADELSRLLGISQVAVRQHLTTLESENAITVTIERRGLGRPAHRYALTSQGDETFPRQYDELANSIIEEVRVWQGDASVAELFDRRRRRMLVALGQRSDSESLGDRVGALARKLSESGYMAEASDNSDGTVTLIKRNCPIMQVACNHPEICCEGDRKIYSDILCARVEQERSMLNGHHTCAFLVSPFCPVMEHVARPYRIFESAEPKKQG